MGRDYLTAAQLAGLANETTYTTIKIELANGSVLRFATADLVINGNAYLGRIETTEPLRMSLENNADKIGFRISNIDLATGQALIADETVFEKSFATLGAFHKSQAAGEWHDEKIVGEIIRGEIDGEWINCKFWAIDSASNYGGIAISSEFTGLPVQPAIIDGIDIIMPPGSGGGGGRPGIYGYDPNDPSRPGGRHVLPILQLL